MIDTLGLLLGVRVPAADVAVVVCPLGRAHVLVSGCQEFIGPLLGCPTV
ncbi:hypothetical protein [Streptomyces exfoliatus]|nr:hypothetical protein [Streptomyces exfoliatus]